MKIQKILAIMIVALLTSCTQKKAVEDVYRYCWGHKDGFTIWIVDGYKVRHEIYSSFLYGGNEQRY